MHFYALYNDKNMPKITNMRFMLKYYQNKTLDKISH